MTKNIEPSVRNWLLSYNYIQPRHTRYIVIEQTYKNSISSHRMISPKKKRRKRGRKEREKEGKEERDCFFRFLNVFLFFFLNCFNCLSFFLLILSLLIAFKFVSFDFKFINCF